jgi:hypothetical protein
MCREGELATAATQLREFGDHFYAVVQQLQEWKIDDLEVDETR